MVTRFFDLHIGIDYSGRETPTVPLKSICCVTETIRSPLSHQSHSPSPRLPIPPTNNLLVLRVILALTSPPRLQALDRQLILPLEDQHVPGLHVHQRSIRVSRVQVLAVAVRFKPCDQFDDFAIGGFQLELQG